MNWKLKISLLALLPIWSFGANALGSANGEIEWMLSYATQNNVYIGMLPAKANNPACATHAVNDFVLQLGTDATRALYSKLLTHYIAGRNVKIVGTGTCVGATEKVLYVITQ